MEEMQKPKKEEEKRRDDKSSARGDRARSARDVKKEKSERNISPPKATTSTLGSYGYSAATATIFNPAVIGLSYRYC